MVHCRVRELRRRYKGFETQRWFKRLAVIATEEQMTHWLIHQADYERNQLQQQDQQHKQQS